MDEEGHQRYPGDFEARQRREPITLHSGEHLAASDRGVTMHRRQFKQIIRQCRSGEQLMKTGLTLVSLAAGNYVEGLRAAASAP